MAADQTTNAALSLAGAALIALGVLSWTAMNLQTQPQSSPGPITLSFHSPAAAIAPGDTREAVFDLPEGANGPTHGVRITARAREASLLTSDRVHELRVSIDECPHGWSTVVRAGQLAYSCDRTPITVLAAQPVLMEGAPVADTPHGNTRHLRIRLHLPSAADNRFQGLRAAITYTFSGQP
jgi:hypothetical protein